MQPARRRDPAIPGGGDPVVCCSDYTRCRVWLAHTEVERHGPSTKKMRDQAISDRRAPDVLSGSLPRDRVSV
jgi:hypothetical protein